MQFLTNSKNWNGNQFVITSASVLSTIVNFQILNLFYGNFSAKKDQFFRALCLDIWQSSSNYFLTVKIGEAIITHVQLKNFLGFLILDDPVWSSDGYSSGLWFWQHCNMRSISKAEVIKSGIKICLLYICDTMKQKNFYNRYYILFSRKNHKNHLFSARFRKSS